MCARARVCVCVCVHVRACVCACACVRACMPHTHTHTHAHTHIHTHTHAHTHMSYCGPHAVSNSTCRALPRATLRIGAALQIIDARDLLETRIHKIAEENVQLSSRNIELERLLQVPARRS